MEQHNSVLPFAAGHPTYFDTPFYKRIDVIIRNWVEGEWEALETIRQEAAKQGWSEARKIACGRSATLTAQNLARVIDNISLSKLRRELDKIDAPSPGQLIRDARITYAKHLLVTGRLLIREVADRAGYREKHFTQMFTSVVGMTPSKYRRLSIRGVSSCPPVG
jgi:AraC-like DNA-binding protein